MQKYPTNPSLYEINTRVWLRQFDTKTKRATLHDVPDSVWQDLQKKGMHIVWLMGVWKINAAALHENDLSEDLCVGYSQALPDWQDSDVIGSPYAIDEYIVSDDLGGAKGLAAVRKQMAKFNLRLMLDFVPNHFSRATRLLNSQPNVFVQASAEQQQPDTYNPELFFTHNNTLFAYGRDPFFAPWWDTVQVNYVATEARQYMTDALKSIATQCDGVRCDMAMLVMNEIFTQTWQLQVAMQTPETEFWVDAINEVKAGHPDFIFMAEAYWDKEWPLQQQGFDYTYDKRLTDCLEEGDVQAVQGHLHANMDFQSRSVRFLENHDEPRAVATFGKHASMVAAVIISTLPGLHFYYDGQLEGKQVRLPVQLGREYIEETDLEIKNFYDKLLAIVNNQVIQSGQWKLLTPSIAWEGNDSFQKMLAWRWEYQQTIKIIVVNFSDSVSQCRLFFAKEFNTQEIVFTDDLAGVEYQREARDVINNGLYIELQPYQSHIFTCQS